MKSLPLDSINLESVSLFVLIFLFLWDFANVFYENPNNIRQFDSFEQLASFISDCNITCDETMMTNNDWHSASSGQDLKTNTILDCPKCPIDLDRLKYFDDVELNTWLNYHHIKHGGRFQPVGCRPKQKIAIIVPYRDRQKHLEKFLFYIHQFLPDQLIDYTVFVIEQADRKPFNRAKLFNVGVAKIKETHPEICCFIFHDVDLMPLDQRNLYMCSSMPRHLSASVSSLRYKLLYPQLFGGVIAMTREHYDLIGGFSDDFYGWGGEDDDALRRVVATGLVVQRTPLEYGTYIMLHHRKEVPNQERNRLLHIQNYTKQSTNHVRHQTREDDDRLKSNYKILSLEFKQLYTHIKCSL